MTVREGGIPFALWGKAKKAFQGVGDFAASVVVDSDDVQALDLDLEASKGPSKLMIKGTARTDDGTFDVKNLKLTQDVEALGGRWKLSPSYDLKSRLTGVGIDYSFQGTVFSLSADKRKQKLKILQPLDEKSSICPTVSTTGDVELEYKRAVLDGTVTATYKPNDSLKLKWQDGPYVASFKAPLDGYYKTSGVKFDLRRAIV